ncbi:MAG TPA: PEP-CTERM sorting domain-containing protein [Vicinamibacterales bacterium]|nr:PEP-CTERM sorting domain-containing protein [Vicinamibacterales bacterium]
MRKWAAFWVTFCIALSTAGAAVADPITITGGTISIGYGRGSFREYVFSLQGDGVAITGSQPDGPVQPAFFPACHEFSPCGEGAVTNPSGAITVLAIGSATLDGVEYPLTQYFGGPSNQFTFTAGDVVIPGGMADVLMLQTPFTFTGLLDIFRFSDTGGWEPLRSVSLTGQGTATVNLQRLQNGFRVHSVDYEFAATPEPGTLLLLGSGAVMVVRRARGRGRRAGC